MLEILPALCTASNARVFMGMFGIHLLSYGSVVRFWDTIEGRISLKYGNLGSFICTDWVSSVINGCKKI